MAVGTCHRIINVFFSMVFGLGVMASAIVALMEAPGTTYDNDAWEAITITAIIVTAIQMVTNAPYLMVNKSNRNKMSGKFIDWMWKGSHLFASFSCTVLFFLAFYLDGLQSADLRTNFWTQFKFDVDPRYHKAYMEALLVFTDLIASNALATLGIVTYPKVSQLWNREGPDYPIQMSISGK